MGDIMNKKLIAIAVAGALSAPMIAQSAEKKSESNGPSVYGLAHVSYGTVETKTSGTTTVDNWQFRSHASRIGVKGKRDFGDGLAGTYKFEWEVDLNSDDYGTGDSTSGFARRNMYVGLKGGFGEFRFGRHDTPLKMAQGKFDQFGDTDADLKHAGDEDGENRLDNILAYIGNFGDFGVAVAVAPGEDAPPGSTADEGPADTISASFSYDNGPLYLAVAHDSYENGGNSAEDSLTRLVGTYKFSGMQVGLLAQSGVEAADTAAAKEDWLGASFSAKVGSKGKIKAQYIQVEDSASPKLEGTLMAVGYDHKFDKKTTGYVMYSNLEEESAGVKSLEQSFLGVGMKLKF